MSPNITGTGDLLRLFQLYLLSTMRVHPDVVKGALEELRSTEAEMRAAREFIVSLGFEEIGAAPGLYRKVLGPPTGLEPLDNGTIPSTFHGSSALFFKLPLWRDFDFVVNEYPGGQDWGPAFKRPRGQGPPPLESIGDLKPWKFLKDEVSNRFGEPESGDAWDYWEELYYMIPSSPGGPLRRCFLLFDYQLLQSFEICDQ